MLAIHEETRLRKRLLSILRQNSEAFQLYYDTYGYTPIEPLLDYLRTLKGCSYITREDLHQVVEFDPERSIEWEKGELIRVTYGFLPTIAKSRLIEIVPPDVFYYGTHRKLLKQVLTGGLLPIASEYVQLADRPEHIGEPTDILRLVTVKAKEAHEAGICFYRVGERYCLSDAIPPRYLQVYAD
ncbi:RNA 2'-phosphotransferase [Brevibacillus antibioticus]|uniref:RNA 2'-phosphotransferase n=1 Tax=Brevibacillus antibioticus TaxID=2570228 RepID=A0A4U2Y2X7_9BACL|nr:RNA 2'-phosphotransferase [Brevibacillus antibioticus]TKI54767.1 RNA 2'-phosphotransferase [Brevibacillus antibioticus]